jgi:hypothetical protein
MLCHLAFPSRHCTSCPPCNTFLSLRGKWAMEKHRSPTLQLIVRFHYSGEWEPELPTGSYIKLNKDCETTTQLASISQNRRTVSSTRVLFGALFPPIRTPSLPILEETGKSNHARRLISARSFNLEFLVAGNVLSISNFHPLHPQTTLPGFLAPSARI